MSNDRLKDFLNIKNSTDISADLYFYGDIVSDSWGAWQEEDQYPEAIRDFLKGQEGKDLNIFINSGGGSVFAGIAIYNMLKRHNGKKTVHVDGLAASIASVIALAGDEIIMPNNSYLMIHKPSNIVWGNATDMRKMADDLDTIQIGIENVYKSKLKEGIDIEIIRGLMDKETWLPASEAEKYFNITLVEENKAVAKLDMKSLKDYKHIPYELKKNINNKKDNIDKRLKNKLQVELDLLNM